MEAFLAHHHSFEKMPFPDLTPAQVTDLVSYIISLRGRRKDWSLAGSHAVTGTADPDVGPAAEHSDMKENDQMASTRDPAFGRKTPRLRAAVPILLAVAGFAASAPAGELMAQAAPTGPAGTTAQQSPQRGPMTDVEARISELHKQLQITPAEEPQFKAYADVMRTNAQMMQTLFQQRAQNPDRTAVGQLRWYAKLTAAHAEAVSKLVAPFEALYQSMSDQQKRLRTLYSPSFDSAPRLTAPDRADRAMLQESTMRLGKILLRPDRRLSGLIIRAADPSAILENGPCLVLTTAALAELVRSADSASGGLSSAEAACRLAEFGPNVVVEERVRPVTRVARHF